MLEFFSYLNKLTPLSPEATAGIMKVIRVKELRKGQVWLQEGAVCDKMTFVIKGLLKLYFESGNKEVILQLAKEEEWMVSAQSYFSNTPSVYTIRSIEQSLVVYILFTDMNHLVERYPELNHHYLLIAKEQATCLEKHTSILLMPPKQRFEELVNKGSWMINGHRLTDRLLGGYLGIGANGVGRWRKG